MAVSAIAFPFLRGGSDAEAKARCTSLGINIQIAETNGGPYGGPRAGGRYYSSDRAIADAERQLDQIGKNLADTVLNACKSHPTNVLEWYCKKDARGKSIKDHPSLAPKFEAGCKGISDNADVDLAKIIDYGSSD